ncbi:MAG: hypothetical protein HY561_09600 [Gemmatimonadetes bacterium]|nr:hypothetical protein [Gemmatimonadota bacterium]
MPGRQMEGDNRFRRKQAREARKRGELPSDRGATFGASKQRHHVSDDAEHQHKIETIREGKQKVIRENHPAIRPRSHRPEHPMTRHKHL